MGFYQGIVSVRRALGGLSIRRSRGIEEVGGESIDHFLQKISNLAHNATHPTSKLVCH